MFSLSSCIHDVIQFHNKFGIATPVNATTDIDLNLVTFRTIFLQEELTEFEDASLFLIPNSPSTNCNYMQADSADALIDLIYIVAGTLAVHGITNIDEFDYDEPEYILQIPLTLNDTTSYYYDVINGEVNEIKKHIDEYRNHTSIDEITAPLLAITARVKYIAKTLGITAELWNELWNDVQRANMSKIRATSANQSKRGSSYDIIKPHDWQPPKTQDIINKHIQDAIESVKQMELDFEQEQE